MTDGGEGEKEQGALLKKVEKYPLRERKRHFQKRARREKKSESNRAWEAEGKEEKENCSDEKGKKSKLKRLLSGSEVLFLAVYWLSVSAWLLVGRDGWLSLVSFTCQSAWQANHRAPCCGAEAVCQPCSSCKWHHLRSGKTVHMTKNIHTCKFNVEIWTVEPAQHQNFESRNMTPCELHTPALSAFWLSSPPLCTTKVTFFLAKKQPRDICTAEHTHTHIHQNIWQTDS